MNNYYVVSVNLNKALSKWEHKEDALENKKEMVEDSGWPTGDLKVWQGKTVKRKVGNVRLIKWVRPMEEVAQVIRETIEEEK